MKLKTRLVIAFVTIITLPLLLSATVIFAFSQIQLHNIEETYNITTSFASLSNPVTVLSEVTESAYQQLTITANREVGK